jgi:hypothetical protein
MHLSWNNLGSSATKTGCDISGITALLTVGLLT